MLKYLKFYESRGITISKAEGQYVWDVEGNKYLDFHTGHGVAFLGHRNPHIVEAIKRQLDEVVSLSTSFNVRIRDEMLETLSKVLPQRFEYVTLLNSGSEAVELALKIARKATRRRKIVSFTKAFHGRTLGALSVTGNPRYKKFFEPLLPGVVIIPFNNIDALDKNIDDSTAAVIVELIQGEGGVNIAEHEFIKALREKCDEVNAVLIFDEVQTGFGRTGRVWVFEYYNVEPDILVAGKAIGGGFPVSLVAIPEYIAKTIEPGDHGSTYGGNPLACAAVKASTEVLIHDNVPRKAFEQGSRLIGILKHILEDNKLVREIRGLGLMIGIELRIAPGNIIRCMQKNHVLALKAGATVVRLLPPYLITEEDINWGVKVIAKCVSEELSHKTTARTT